MKRRRERGGIPIAALGLGLGLLLLVAGFVWWVGAEEPAPSSCEACLAAEAGELDGVRAALAAQATLEKRREEATRALDAALERLEVEGATNARELVLALLVAGADPNQFTLVAGVGLSGRSGQSGKTVAGRTGGPATPLYAAERAIGLGDMGLLERFIAAGLEVNGKPGGAALTRAAGTGHLAAVQALIRLGAPVNHRHDELGSPLAAAVHGRHREVAALLDLHDAREWQ